MRSAQTEQLPAMGFNCGIVGLPNVGKSTLFNALIQTQSAQAANYPFCTIEPNRGKVGVPDFRLAQIAALAKSQKVIATQLEIVDIAGLVKGAAQGEGLGNQFLANIRETDAILQLVRCFEDTNIEHVEDSIDPVRDAETINTELLLADLESLEKRVESLGKKVAVKDKDALALMDTLVPCLEALRCSQPIRSVDLGTEQRTILNNQGLLTAKPLVYVCNVGEDDLSGGNAHSAAIDVLAAAEGAGTLRISAVIEEEIAQLDAEDRASFLAELGLEGSGLDRLIRTGYALLDLTTFFTAGPKESHAWTVRSGATAPQAAGVIHGDFKRGFIRAETIAFDDYIACGGEQGAKEAGKQRIEGKDYLVKDGDIFHFRFNV